jgi:hypothetical protein
MDKLGKCCNQAVIGRITLIYNLVMIIVIIAILAAYSDDCDTPIRVFLIGQACGLGV